MSACISCWICATIESVLDDMAMLLRHNRWVVLPIIAQSRRPFNATTFICRFRMRRHGLWSHSYQILFDSVHLLLSPCRLVTLSAHLDKTTRRQGDREHYQSRFRITTPVRHTFIVTWAAIRQLFGWR